MFPNRFCWHAALVFRGRHRVKVKDFTHSIAYFLQVIDRGGPVEMLQLLLDHDPGFVRAQERHQEQYAKLCQVLKKAQRYPVSKREKHPPDSE
jgi:hypothetical protein